MDRIGRLFSKLQHSYIGFIAIFLVCYFVMYYFNVAYIGLCAKGGPYIPFLDEHLNYIRGWRHFSIESTATIIRWMGYQVKTADTMLGVYGRNGISLVYACLGYDVMAAFTAFLIAFPRAWRTKFKFWIFGLLLIQVLNICRFVFLALFWSNERTFLGLNHHDLFNVFIYLILMLSVYIWLNISFKNESNPTQKGIRHQ